MILHSRSLVAGFFGLLGNPSPHVACGPSFLACLAMSRRSPFASDDHSPAYAWVLCQHIAHTTHATEPSPPALCHASSYSLESLLSSLPDPQPLPNVSRETPPTQTLNILVKDTVTGDLYYLPPWTPCLYAIGPYADLSVGRAINPSGPNPLLGSMHAERVRFAYVQSDDVVTGNRIAWLSEILYPVGSPYVL